LTGGGVSVVVIAVVATQAQNKPKLEKLSKNKSNVTSCFYSSFNSPRIKAKNGLTFVLTYVIL
jgi:hypothetical protein